jgi:hypothetical protein
MDAIGFDGLADLDGLIPSMGDVAATTEVVASGAPGYSAAVEAAPSPSAGVF